MSDRKWRTWEVLGLIFVLAAGNLLHFVYEWCGESPIAGVLASVNESTWEHMKLLTTPWVLWSIVEFAALRRTGLPVLTARAAGLLAGLAAIPLLFYGYQGVLGRDIMWLDVAIFQIAVLLGFWVTWAMLRRRALASPVWQVAGAAVLAAMPLCMAGLCWLLPGRWLRLWSLVLAVGLTLHGTVLSRRVPGGELVWYVLAILVGIAYLLLTVGAPDIGPFADPAAAAMGTIPF